jgi:peptidoglycan/xylan/chitin deacetylase (PgdA/CDA1 family)
MALIILTLYEYCSPILTFGIIGFVYWLPKFFFVRLLEYLYPLVITRNVASKSIYLTFDDTPYTFDSFKKILDILNNHNIKATFFIIGNLITSESEDLLITAIQSGHLLANHGLTDSMHLLHEHASLENEIFQCDQLIKDLYVKAGVNFPVNRFYRPGCGLFNSQMLKSANSFGLKTALGSVYPNDPVVRSSYLNYLYLKAHIGYGDVVIVHDRPWTPMMLDHLIPWIKSNDLECETLDKI